MANEKELIKVVIVTPNGICYEHYAQILVLDAIDGEIGIMANHQPIVIPLAIGEVRVKRQASSDEKMDKVAVNGGYLEFSNNTATVIADSAERGRDIDLARAESAKERAERHLREAQEKQDEVSRARAEVALRRAINRIKVHNEE
mgnify:CR=1 FL=1